MDINKAVNAFYEQMPRGRRRDWSLKPAFTTELWTWHPAVC